MGKIGANFGQRERLTVEHLEGDAALLTIKSVDTFKYDGQDTMVVKFEETADAGLFVNRTMLTALLHHLGDETDEWIGKQVPVENRTVPFNGENVDKVYVMDADQWAGAFTEAGEEVPDYVKVAPEPKSVEKSDKGKAKSAKPAARRAR